MATVFQILNEILSCYSVILAILGTLGNFIAAGVCFRKPLRKIPTFVFTGVISFVDIMILYHWNINNFFTTYFGFFIPDLNATSCRLTSFLQMGFSQASSYLLIALTLERYLSIKVKNWRNVYFNAKKALITSLLIILFFILLNFHLTVSLPFEPVANKTNANLCFSSKLYLTWRELHTYIYSIIPFLVLAVINSLLIYEVIRSKNTTTSTSNEVHRLAKNRSMSISVITFTVAFIVLTGPFAFGGGYFLTMLLKTDSGRAILFSLVVTAHTYHGANLVILLCSNKKFKTEFKAMLVEMKLLGKNQVSDSSAVNSTTMTRVSTRINKVRINA